jgi:hypothetical protein
MTLDKRTNIAPDATMTIALEMATCDACHEWSVVNLAADHPEPCPLVRRVRDGARTLRVRPGPARQHRVTPSRRAREQPGKLSTLHGSGSAETESLAKWTRARSSSLSQFQQKTSVLPAQAGAAPPKAAATNDSMESSEQAELEHLRQSLHGWALLDLEKTVKAGAKVGAFILAGNLLDVLARLAYSKPGEKNAKAAWDEFVPVYLPAYEGSAELLYRGFRSAISHNYSLDGIRLVDGRDYGHRHWTVEQGERVLHLETFVADLRAAFDALYEKLHSDPVLRQRVLARTGKRPLLGIVGDPTVPLASGARSLIALAEATSWAAPTASGADSPANSQPSTSSPRQSLDGRDTEES